MNKTRNLSVAEYFIQIQREYLIADFRRRIYFNPRDKAYWNKVCKYKEEKINAIAERSNLHSILNNDDKLKEFKEMLFDSNGKPKFIMDEKDLHNYYSRGNEFCYKGEIYTLEDFNGEMLKLIDAKNNVIEVGINDANRIL